MEGQNDSNTKYPDKHSDDGKWDGDQDGEKGAGPALIEAMKGSHNQAE